MNIQNFKSQSKFFIEVHPPSLPKKFIPRPELLKTISTAILMSDSTLTDEVTVMIKGVGGIGKSTIAKALCHEQLIKEHFTDGFIWISLTPPQCSVTDELCKIYSKLTKQQINGTLSFIKDRIQSFLTQYSYKLLVILDDVWNAKDASVYVEVFKCCKILLTTRMPVVESQIQTKNLINVEQMKSDEAIKLLRSCINELKTSDKEVEAMMHKLAEDLFCWPLLLNLVSVQLEIHCMKCKMPLRDAILFITQKLSKDLTAFDQTTGRREEAVKVCLDASLDLLHKQDIRILQTIVMTLGGFGPYAIKSAVATLSGMSYEKFNDSLMNLWSHGLVELTDLPSYHLGPSTACIGIHNIIACYIIETMSVEQCFEMAMGHVSLFHIPFKELEKSNVGLAGILLFMVRFMAVLTHLVRKYLSTINRMSINKLAFTDKSIKSGLYTTMREDSVYISSLITNNKHDAIQCIKKFIENHPLYRIMQPAAVEIMPWLPLADQTLLTSFFPSKTRICNWIEWCITVHKLVGVLAKIKASKEDIDYFSKHSTNPDYLFALLNV